VQVVDWLIFASFFIDICFNFCRQYRDLNGMMVKSHKLIAIKYVKSGWLIIDILGTLPF
jgi:hypothetical protein